MKFQTVFVGKATNALTGYFGCVALDKPVASGVTVTLQAGFTEYGRWFSDGGSHALDGSSAVVASQINKNNVWFIIPASGITNANTLAWIRLDGTIDFT